MSDLLEEIKEFIRFGVAENDYGEAVEFASKYEDDENVLRLLYQHYSELPEACEQPVNRIVEISAKQGVQLLLVITVEESHYYLLSKEQVLWLGLVDMVVDQEVLTFFDIENQKGLQKIVSHVLNEEQQKETTEQEEKKRKKHCAACGVLEGEYHLLGCVVEICPWCEGQVSQCNCRFDLLGVEEITSEEELDQFEELLEKKGRIPFRQDDLPAYPGTSKGLDV